MERKNTVLLTVIAVATLLVAVVGATFAYFTASGSGGGPVSGASADVETASLAKVQLTASAIEGINNDKIYPGTKNAVGATVTATTTGAEAGQKYKVEYTITGKVKPSTAFTQGTLTYELFRTTQKVETPVSCPEPSATADGNEVHYTRICNNDAKLSEAVSLTTGTGDATSAEDAFTYKDEIIADGNTTYYYYLVVTYQSKEEDQSDDATKSVTLSIDSVTANNTSSVS